MDPVILTIEVTGEMNQALGDIAEEQMVTKEDIARGIIAVHLAKARESHENYIVAFVGGILQAAGTALLTAKQKQTADRAFARLSRRPAVQPKGE